MALISSFNLEYDTPIEIPADPPGVPEKISHFLGARLKGLKRIVIQFEQARKRWIKINAFKLDGSPGKNTTAELDEICVAIMVAISAHYTQQQRGDELPGPKNYRVMCNLHEGQGDAARPSVEYLFNPAGEEAEMHDVAPREQTDDVYVRILDRLERQNQDLFGMIKDTVTKNNDIANTNLQALAPFASMFGFMTQVWQSGATMQQQALNVIYSARKDEIEATSSERRIDKVIDAVRGPIAMVIKHKYGIDLPLDEDEDEDEDDGDTEPSPAQRSASKPSKTIRPTWDGSTPTESNDDSAPVEVTVRDDAGETTEPRDDELSEDPPERRPALDQHPAALYASELGRMIRPAQWLVLSKKLERKELEALVRVFEAKTDATLVKRYDAVFAGGAVPLEKLLGLQKLLSKAQLKHLETLSQIVERARKAWA